MKELYLITGFLGAGKTTFVNRAVSVFKDKKVAVIVNEFGKQGIDGSLISKNGYDVTEISNGSIFCVCRSDMFIDALKDALKADIDVLIVETSGLSNPTGMDDILEQTTKVTGEAFDYKGCICIIDAVNFRRVFSTVVVVVDQIKQSSLIIVNKVDLASQEVLDQITKDVRALNTHCEIVYTNYSMVSDDVIKDIVPIGEKITGGKVDISSVSTTLEFISDINLTQLQQLINEVTPLVYRIKGNVLLGNEWYFIDGVMDNVSITKIDGSDSNNIVLLYKNTSPVKKTLKRYCEENHIDIKFI